MRVISADQYPGAEHQPLYYPGRRPEFSFAYYQGKGYEITFKEGGDQQLVVEEPTGYVTLDEFLAQRGNAPMNQRLAVLAVASNGCPGRFEEKYESQSDMVLPVLVGTLTDTAIVYSRRLVSYGALPATYLFQPDAVSWLSVTMLTNEQLEHMDGTENVGTVYERIQVPGKFQLQDGHKIGNLTAYIDQNILTYQGAPVLLKMFTRSGPDWPVMDESEILSLVFNEAGLLPGESIEVRHRCLLEDADLRRRLNTFLENRMSGLTLDMTGRLVS